MPSELASMPFALTDCNRDAVVAFIRGLYLAGVKEPDGLMLRACRRWR